MRRSALVRLACIDLPALPLQLLIRRHPEWAGHPVAVVAEDKPQALILWVNERARRIHVLPGLRYAAALSLGGDLRAGVVVGEEIEQLVVQLTDLLRDFTPDVEPFQKEPGVFWLDASGLKRLYPSATAWAGMVHGALVDSAYDATVVVGFSRFGTYAVAKSSSGVVVFRDAEEERRAAREVPLDRLGIEPELRSALEKLGVRKVGEFLDLPASGIRKRFGEEAHQLHRSAAGELWRPLEPKPVESPVAARAELEYADGDVGRLLFIVKRLLDGLLEELAGRQQAVEELRLDLRLDTGERRQERVRPAVPTLEGVQLLDLVRLRLEGVFSGLTTGRKRLASRPPTGVEEIELTVEGVSASGDQLRLFLENSRRDLRAAARALARVRTELGSGAVVRARLGEGHLPEATFLWEPVEKLDWPHPWTPAERILVRRIYAKARPLPPRPHHLRDDGWLMRGAAHGPVVRLIGPYVVAGGWWMRPVHREYHYAETQRGDLLWVYYDRRRRRWFLHGEVA